MAFTTDIVFNNYDDALLDCIHLMNQAYLEYTEVHESQGMWDWVSKLLDTCDAYTYESYSVVVHGHDGDIIAAALVTLDEDDNHVVQCSNVVGMYIQKEFRTNREVVRELNRGIRLCYPDEKWLCYGVRNKHGHTERKYRRQHGYKRTRED